MKLALIPPKSLITEYIGGRDYHMMVPAALEDPEVRRLYRRERGFKILDNGMYEGVMWPNKDLIELALEVKPDEIIMPDSAGDFPGTYGAQMEFIQQYCEMWPKEGYSPLLMAVIQGETHHDRMQHAMRLLNMRDEYQENMGVKLSFGFPRRLVTPDDHYARVNLIEWIIRTYGKVPMHMLGLPSCWPTEILRAARQFGPYLRGMDTSAPFTWAYANATLNAVDGIERPDNYFMQPEVKFNRTVVNANIDQLQRWCNGTA
jgi:hypothetical protein